MNITLSPGDTLVISFAGTDGAYKITFDNEATRVAYGEFLPALDSWGRPTGEPSFVGEEIHKDTFC